MTTTTHPRYIAGVDPGLSGAIALYDGADFTVIDMPVFAIKVGDKLRNRIDMDALARWVDLHGANISLAVIEAVGPSPRDGVAGAFSFGKSAGIAEMAFAANFVPRHPANPGKWKRALGLSSDKDASRALASRMFPAAAHLWARKKDDGRAEAALLAWYGSKLKERGEV